LLWLSNGKISIRKRGPSPWDERLDESILDMWQVPGGQTDRNYGQTY
jgi:hypothetical protein